MPNYSSIKELHTIIKRGNFFTNDTKFDHCGNTFSMFETVNEVY